MMRPLPGLGLLLVTFGTGIRTDDLGGIGRNDAIRGQTENHQQAAETKYGRPERDPGPEPDRPKATRSQNDNDCSPLLQPSDKPASAVPACCEGGRERSDRCASPWAWRAIP